MFLLYFYVKAFDFSITTTTIPSFDEQMNFVKQTLLTLKNKNQDPYVQKDLAWLSFARLGYTQTKNAIQILEIKDQENLQEALNNFWDKILQEYPQGLNLMDLKMVNLHYTFILSSTETNKDLLQSQLNNPISRYTKETFYLMNQDLSTVSFKKTTLTGGSINSLKNLYCFFITFYSDKHTSIFNVTNFLNYFFDDPCIFISFLPSENISHSTTLPHRKELIQNSFFLYLHDLTHEESFVQIISYNFFTQEQNDEDSTYTILKTDFSKNKEDPTVTAFIFSLIHSELSFTPDVFIEHAFHLFRLKNYSDEREDDYVRLIFPRSIQTKENIFNNIAILVKTFHEEKRIRLYTRAFLALKSLEVDSLEDFYNLTSIHLFSSIKNIDNFQLTKLGYDFKNSKFFYTNNNKQKIYIDIKYTVINQTPSSITLTPIFTLSPNDNSLEIALSSINNVPINKPNFIYNYELNSSLKSFIGDFRAAATDIIDFSKPQGNNYLNYREIKQALKNFKTSVEKLIDPMNTIFKPTIMQDNPLNDTSIIENLTNSQNIQKIFNLFNSNFIIIKDLNTLFIDNCIIKYFANQLKLSPQEIETLEKQLMQNTYLQKHLKRNILDFSPVIYYQKLYKNFLTDFHSLFLEHKKNKENQPQIEKEIKDLISNLKSTYFFF